MTIIKVRCKICKAEATIDRNARTMKIVYLATSSPLRGSTYPHRSTRECPLTQGLLPDALILHPSIEVLEG